MECFNFPEGVKEQLYKQASICLCPNLSGQICMVREVGGPRAGGQHRAWWMHEGRELCVGCASMGAARHAWLQGREALCTPHPTSA